MRDVVEEAADALRRAIENGETADETGQMQFVVDALRSMRPEAPVPEKLDSFSVLVGCSFALGSHRAKGCRL